MLAKYRASGRPMFPVVKPRRSIALLIQRYKRQAVLNEERPVGQSFFMHIERCRGRQQVGVSDCVVDDEQAGIGGLQ